MSDMNKEPSMSDLARMITSVKNDLTKSISDQADALKHTVDKVVAPIVKRQDEFEEQSEKRFASLEEQSEKRYASLEAKVASLSDLIKDSNSVKSSPQIQDQPQPNPTISCSTAYPPLPPPDWTGYPASGVLSAIQPSPVPSDDLLDTLAKAKRIISLQPIDWRRDVERQTRQYENITTTDQAMHSAVIEYLRGEMKMREGEIPTIVSIFPPANTPKYDRLYVEFEDEYSAEYVSGCARVLRKSDHQVSIYVPRSFQPRFQALNAYAKTVRTAPGSNPGDIKTKIRYGKADFVLLTKSKNGRWTEVKTLPPSLPPLLSSSVSVSSDASPPPGRSRGSPSPPPPNKKRGAPSPLERMSKASRSSDNLVSDTNYSPTPQQTPGTPSHTPTLALSGVDAQASPANRPSPPRQDSVAVPSLDSGMFGQTAVCSPRLITNKHFTFETNARRLSLPSSSAKTHLN